MAVLSRSVYVLSIIDALVIACVSFIGFSFVAHTYAQLFTVVGLFLFSVLFLLGMKGFYKIRKYGWKDIYLLFEGILVGSFLGAILATPILKDFVIGIVLINILLIFSGILFARICFILYKKILKPTKNILIVGAGQDGKLIAEEIQARPELGMKVVGFLDDNMNNIEEEDSTIPILGLTYDSEAVIKDNNIDMVIVAVKSRMDSNILTDLAKGIPLGVKVWRMPTFYAHITQKTFY